MSLSFGGVTILASVARSEIQVLPTPPLRTIHSLPDEILAYIFVLSSRSPNTFPTPSAIIRVCTRWRQLALTSGEIWTYTLISYPVNARELRRAQFWLQNSGPYPLNITIDLRDPDWNFVEYSHPVQWFEMQAIMGTILPEIQRWREIDVVADNWAPLHAFLHYVQNMSPPLLRRLSLQRSNPYFAAPSQTFAPAASRIFLPLFSNKELEELKIVELQGVHIDWGMVKS